MNPELATHAEWRGRTGPSLRALIGETRVQLDPTGVRAAFGEAEPGDATCILGARRPWPHIVKNPDPRPLRAQLSEACAHIPPGTALALSGGVDSAVLAALLRDRIHAYTLAPSFPNYGELDEAATIADALDIPLRRVPLDEHDLVSALPAAIRACETPLYNLHPVSRHHLARAIRADGHTVLISGDGADEIFRGTTGADYLPIVGALTRAAGLRAFAPFLALSAAHDPDKRPLRALACELGVPESIAWRPKTPRYAPALDLAPHRDPAHLLALARSLGRDPDDATDRARVAWTTLSLFARTFPGLDLACVASPD